MSSEEEIVLCDKYYSNVETTFLPVDMYTAASLGDVAFFMKFDVGQLVSKLSIPNASGWTPFMFACARGHALLVNYLLMSGARRCSKTNSGVTPLMLAISSGDVSTVESVFDVTELEKKDYRNWTPLFYAVHFAREKCLNFLLLRGADVNIVDYQNETPLMAAIKLGRETMVELLLKTARNLDTVSYKNESALMLANESNNSQIQSMVKTRWERLKKQEIVRSPGINTTPVRVINTFSATSHHCSPTPLKQQIKSQLSLIKFSKSLNYSPNKAANKQTPKKLGVEVSSAWRISFPKKFWSPQLRPYDDVEKFLKSLGLEKYWPVFRDEEVDFETLLTLNEDNLKELGIKLFGPRKKIFLAIQQLRNRY